MRSVLQLRFRRRLWLFSKPLGSQIPVFTVIYQSVSLGFGGSFLSLVISAWVSAASVYGGVMAGCCQKESKDRLSNVHTKVNLCEMKKAKKKMLKEINMRKREQYFVGQCLVVGRLAGWLAGTFVWYGGLWFRCRCNLTGGSGCSPFCRRQTLSRTGATHTQTQKPSMNRDQTHSQAARRPPQSVYQMFLFKKLCRRC